MIGILLYIFFIYSSNKDYYLRNRSIHVLKKITNVLFSFILFFFFYYELKTYFLKFISLDFYPLRIENALLYFKSFYVYTSYYIYFFAALYMFVVSINLAQGKQNGRKQFLKSVFIIIPIVCNNFVLVRYHLYGSSTENHLPIVLILVFVTLVFLLYFLLYRLKWMNQIFENIKEISNEGSTQIQE